MKRPTLSHYSQSFIHRRSSSIHSHSHPFDLKHFHSVRSPLLGGREEEGNFVTVERLVEFVLESSIMDGFNDEVIMTTVTINWSESEVGDGDGVGDT